MNNIGRPGVQEQEWDRIVRPKSRLFDLHLKDIWNYRDLVLLFVRRDYISQYKQTILGPAWQFIQPALTTAVFLLLFNRIAKIPTDGLPPVLFLMAGITIWNYFANCLNNIANTFVSNAYIFGKVYFPRLVLPISLVISNLVRLSIQFSLLILVMIYYKITGYNFHFSPKILLLPLLFVQIAALGLGLGIIISSITTKYRDFTVLLAFAIQLLMYATPVVYPLSFIKGRSYQWVLDYNPLTFIIECFRYLLFNKGTIDLNSMCYSMLFTVIILISGVVLFNRVGKTFIDTV